MFLNKDFRDFKFVSYWFVIGDDLDVVEGFIVYISCLIIGNFVFEIYWKIFGGLIFSSERLWILNNIFGILDGIWFDFGIYLCIVINGVGFDEMVIWVNFMGM